MAVNSKRSYTGTGTQVAIPLNRHGNPQFSLSVQISATATYTMQATIGQVNQSKETIIWNDIPSMTGLTGNSFQKITNSPLEALRLNIIANTGTVSFQLLQND